LRISLTSPKGALIIHQHIALFGYLFSSYPGDLIIPVGDVNITGGSPRLQAWMLGSV